MRLKHSFCTFAVIALSSVAVANEKAVPVQTASTSSESVPVVQVAQTRSGIFQPVRRQGQGIFGRLMELERRKQAWLRRSFGN
jgi:hypothetical protein